MRRFLTISFILLALAVSAAGVAPAAHAQVDPTAGAGDGTGFNNNASEPVDPKAAAAATHTPTEQGQVESSRRGLNYVMSMIAGLFAWLVGVAALTLNFSMYYTVVNMGGYITNLPAIKTVWEILRDIGNILLIFGFLAIGISIIIDSDWYGGGQKLLPKLLIVAVFANFSLFAAEAMIDVGNLFATQIYKQINEGKIPNPSDTSATTGFAYVIQNKGVAGVLMNKLGLPSIYGEAKGVGADGTTLFAGNSPWYMGFMSIILFIVMAFVMFTLALILIARFIVLILLIMVSPIGIVGLAVPGLQGWADKWWHTLFHQTITAPILLLMLYIALSVIVDPKFLGFGTGSTPAWNGIATSNFIGFAGILLSYLIAMGLLLAVVYFAKTLSSVGAGWATKYASKLSGASIVASMPGRIGRRTIGGSGRYLGKRIGNTRFGGTFAGRHVADTLEKKVGGANFDFRNTDLGKTVAGYGLDMGKGQKGGRNADIKASTESYERAADRMKGNKGRKSTKEEEKTIMLAVTGVGAATREHAKAKDEHDAVTAKYNEHKAEVERLEKEKERRRKFSITDFGEDRKLEAARTNLVASETARSAATGKLLQMEEAKGKAISEEEKVRDVIKTATADKSDKEAKRDYATKLESRWWNPAATGAAKRIKENAGKSKEERRIETLLARIEKVAGEDGEEDKKEKKDDGK